MPIHIRMPALSPTMEEGKLAKWLKAEGDAVRPGDVIAEIETDKATMEVEAADEGVLGRIVVPAGTEHVKVNATIALLLTNGEDRAALDQEMVGERPPAQAGKEAPIKAGAEAPAQAGEAAPAQAVGKPSALAEVGGEAPPQASVLAPAATAPLDRRAAPEETEYTGETKTATVREALRDAMAEEMRRDPTVFLIGEEVAQYQGAYKVSQGLLQEFGPERVIDTPITEHGFTGLGVGAAFNGLRPIVEFMTFNFAMQAMDQIINSAAKTRYMSGGQVSCPIVFRGPNGAAARVAAQHSQDYSSWYAHCPGLIVIAPWSAADAKGLLKSAIRNGNPVIFLENEILYGRNGEVPVEADHIVPIGRARIVRRGRDVTITAFSRMMELALTAADQLAKDGIEAEVIDLRTLRPLDAETVIASVKRTNRMVSVEEGWPFAGIGAELGMMVMEQAFDWLDAPVARVCGEDIPMPYAANLEALALPSVAKIVKAVQSVTYRS
jgi:pyruvate dehydrogenase E1 component beta subunit